MAVSSVGSSPIYPCPIRARVLNALIFMRSLDWRSVVTVRARPDLASHAVGVAKFGIRSHACPMSASDVIPSMINAQTYHCVCR